MTREEKKRIREIRETKKAESKGLQKGSEQVLFRTWFDMSIKMPGWWLGI